MLCTRQEIGWEDCLRLDLFHVERTVKHYTTQLLKSLSLMSKAHGFPRAEDCRQIMLTQCVVMRTCR